MISTANYDHLTGLLTFNKISTLQSVLMAEVFFTVKCQFSEVAIVKCTLAAYQRYIAQCEFRLRNDLGLCPKWS